MASISSEELRLTDAAVLRALTSPTRLRILTYLHRVGQAHTTACGQVVRLSSSAASYHLNHLAKHGLVQRVDAPDDQRETWWAPVGRGFRVSPAEPEAAEAVRLFRSVLFEEGFSRVRSFLEHYEQFDLAWQQEAGFNLSPVYLTLDELGSLREAFDELVAKYLDRTPETAPEGAVLVHVLAGATPEPPRPRSP